MATIAGSQFNATAGLPVNVVVTDTGAGLPSTVPGAFNLEVFIGSVVGAPPIAPGYQGLAVLAPGGHTIDLISGAYAVTDNGIGDSLNADGSFETISGGANFVNLTLNGNNDVANGGGLAGDFIQVNGTADTVNGGTGPETINVDASGDVVNAGSGADGITAIGNSDTITGGSGPDTITAIGNNDSVTGGSGPDLINVIGTGETVTGGGGNDAINVFGAGNTVIGGSGSDTVGLYGDTSTFVGGAGPATVLATGTGDTVTAGGGNLTVTTAGPNLTFNDNSSSVYNDTVVGFSNGASNGDTIQLTGGDTVQSSSVVGGNTVVHLSDGSQITLVGVTDITNIFHP